MYEPWTKEEEDILVSIVADYLIGEPQPYFFDNTGFPVSADGGLIPFDILRKTRSDFAKLIVIKLMNMPMEWQNINVLKALLQKAMGHDENAYKFRSFLVYRSSSHFLQTIESRYSSS